jgi:putative membrane protein insertion efficiency factor
MKSVLMGLIRLYQLVLSPVVNWRGPVCRYHPSCSHYGYEAVKTHGSVRGGAMTVWRVLRCNPWSAGGYDPVKPKKTRQARNLSDPETSSPGGPQTSDRSTEVGNAVPPDPQGTRPDPMSSRGA